MNKISPSTVEQRIQNGYNFDLGKYISEGFTIFSKEWLLSKIISTGKEKIRVVALVCIFGGNTLIRWLSYMFYRYFCQCGLGIAHSIFHGARCFNGRRIFGN